MEDRDWYRAEARRRRAKAEAGASGAWQAFEGRGPASSQDRSGNQVRAASVAAKPSTRLHFGPAGWVLVIAAIGLAVVHAVESGEGIGPITAAFVDVHMQRPVAFPVNGYTKLYFEPAGLRLAPLTIQTSPEVPDLKSVISVRDWATGRQIASVFLEANSIITVNLPAGEYRLVTASGRAWFGDESLFGQATQVQRSLRSLELRSDPGRVLGQTVQLMRTDRPNFPTERVPRQEFGEP